MRKIFPAFSRQSGVGLVEIMVGLAVGLITAVIVMQVMTAYNTQKRTAASGTDADTNASIALFLIQRQVQLTGYGLPIFSPTASPLNTNICRKMYSDEDDNPDTPDIEIDFAPVVIIDGGTGAGASDTLILRRGGTDTAGIPVKIINIPPAPLSAPVTITVENNLGCDKPKSNVVLFGGNDGSCTLDKVKSIPMDGTQKSRNKIELKSGLKAKANESIACLGEWNEVILQVNNGNLAAKGSPLVSNIINLQAQYGISDTGTSEVSRWVDATGDWASSTITRENRNKIRAIRVAVVARSAQMETGDISNSCTTREGLPPGGVCAWIGTTESPAPTIDLSDDPNWKRYRYRVHETIIPIRNYIWNYGELK